MCKARREEGKDGREGRKGRTEGKEGETGRGKKEKGGSNSLFDAIFSSMFSTQGLGCSQASVLRGKSLLTTGVRRQPTVDQSRSRYAVRFGVYLLQTNRRTSAQRQLSS
ncbi:hypothetical protein CGCS363_v008100 [Colletotrichum siamense]|uniref:uncharacterized protein n=1 Tax=Colletotrichum siamense TaxID=690259 RepID=UPI001872CA6A|nr:uncharacterized protein CGCS363_v008100 [Colletotrichum siamense]KAF5497537.1 hypothetical protein CGCS363_v008100 [Colletotrichum siamense]